MMPSQKLRRDPNLAIIDTRFSRDKQLPTQYFEEIQESQGNETVE
jgi:hypothetical protein